MNIGTLTDQINLSDEQIDALPKVIKFIKNEIACKGKEEKTGTKNAEILRKLMETVDLDELDFDPLTAEPGFSVKLVFAVAATAAVKKEKKDSAEIMDKAVSQNERLVEELQKKDEQIENLQQQLVEALQKKNPSNFRDFGSLPGFGTFGDYWMSDSTGADDLFNTSKTVCSTVKNEPITQEQKKQAKKIRSLIDEIFDSADYFTNHTSK